MACGGVVSLYPYPDLLFVNRRRGTFNLHVGCANTQGTSVILSPEKVIGITGITNTKDF